MTDPDDRGRDRARARRGRRLHGELVRYGLVVWTGGNVSGRVPGTDYFVIKPSGVSYDDLTPENMILCDLDGDVVPGTPGSDRSPSSDTAAHAYVYREMPEVGGVVHTHSTYAVAWAARGEEIPCVITGMADEFGGPIPIGPFAIIGDDSIGRGIVETLRGHRSRAVLMQNHGPFTIGVTAKDAVKAAVMCEDAARTVHIARRGRPAHPDPAGPDRPALRPLPERVRAERRRPAMSARMTRARRDRGRARGARHRARLDPHQGLPDRRRPVDGPRGRQPTSGRTSSSTGVWTYSLDAVWSGLQAAYADLVADVERRYGVAPTSFAGDRGVGDDARLPRLRRRRRAARSVPHLAQHDDRGRGGGAHRTVRRQHPAALVDRPPAPGGSGCRAARPADPVPHDARRLRALAAHRPQGARRRRCVGHVPDRLGDATTTTPSCSSATTSWSTAPRLRLDAARAASRGARRGPAGGRADRRGRRAARPERGAATRAPCSARPKATPAPAWSRRTRSPPAPATSAPARASSRWSCSSGRCGIRITSSTSSRHRPATRSRWCTATTARASSPPGWACSGASPRPRASPLDADAVYETLFREALDGEADAGGLLAYNQLAGEPIAGLSEGRPLFVRTPDSRFTLANFMRAQLYGVFGTLSLGMRVLADEGVGLDRMYAHGGIFRTAGVAQRFLAGGPRRPRHGRRERVGGRRLGHRGARRVHGLAARSST